MEIISTYQTIWFIIIGFLLAGYSILDGFDLGVGIIFPFLAKNDADKSVLIRTIGPVWDGNEVWLVTGGAALFAAFPLAYATVFSGFYLAMMLVLLALIFRAVSLEFWTYDEPRRKMWGYAFTLGSFLAALLLGVALGNVVYGIPLTDGHEYAGGFFTLLRPYPLLIGLMGLTAIILQGSAYTALKTEGHLRDAARRVSSGIIPVLALLFLAALTTHLITSPDNAGKPQVWVFVALFCASLAAHRFALSGKKICCPSFSLLPESRRSGGLPGPCSFPGW